MASERERMSDFEAMKAAKVGHKFVDKFDEGLRFIVLRGPFHPCAYVGIPEDHPLAGYDYEALPINAHGGLTYAAKGTGTYLPTGFYWYGWDYGHCDDYMISDTHSESYATVNETRTKWDAKSVESDSWTALYDFRKLMKLAEEITRKAASPVTADQEVRDGE